MSRKQKVAALSLGNGLAKVIGLATVMVMARVLAKEDLAAYQQAFLAYATVAPVLSLGVGQGMYYFLPGETERLRGRVVDGIIALAAMGLLFAIFIACGGNELLARRFSNPQVSRLLLWMIPFAIVTLPASAAESVFVSRDYVRLAACFGVGRQLVIGAATALPLVFWQTAKAPFIGNIIASMCMATAAIFLMIRVASSGAPWPTVAGIRELILFTGPIALGGMIATVSMQLDKLIVSLMCPPEEFAVYSLGAIEVPLIGVVTSAVTSVALADMRKSVVEGHKGDALLLFNRIAEKSSLVILPVMMFLLLTADSLVVCLYSINYADSAKPFRVYLMLLPIRTVVFSSLLVVLGKSHFMLVRSVVALMLNICLSFLFVRELGPWGAAIATVLTIYIWVVPSNLFVLSDSLGVSWKKILPFKPMAICIRDLLPLLLLSSMIVFAIESVYVELFSVASCFAVYLTIYWNHRLYSARSLFRRLFAS